MIIAKKEIELQIKKIKKQSYDKILYNKYKREEFLFVIIIFVIIVSHIFS